jgi:HEAT repeat protein
MELGSLDEHVVPLLISMLSDPDPKLRSGAALAIGHILSYCNTKDDITNALPMLQRPIEDTDGWVRFHSSQALWAISERYGYAWFFDAGQIVRLVIECLHFANPEVRAAAAYQLTYPGTLPDLVIPPLIETLSDTEIKVRFAAADALSHFGSDAMDALPVLTQWLDSTVQSDRFIAAAAIMAMDDAYEDELVPILLDSFQRLEPVSDFHCLDDDLRPRAAYILASFGRNAYQTVPLLAHCTGQGENHRLRLAALNALAGCGFPVEVALRALTDALRDQSREVVSAAIAGLGVWGRHAVVALPQLLRVLDTESYMGQKKSREEGDLRFSVISEVCRLLRQMGPKARTAIPHLLRLIREESPEIGGWARWALQTITARLSRFTFEYRVPGRRIKTTVFGQSLADARMAFRQRLKSVGHLDLVDVERCEPMIARRK